MASKKEDEIHSKKNSPRGTSSIKKGRGAASNLKRVPSDENIIIEQELEN